jgi:hypothetical protein
MGLVFMGAIVVPVYLVPALAVVLGLGLAAETRLSRSEQASRLTGPGRAAELIRRGWDGW